jgi:hypothetical protein
MPDNNKALASEIKSLGDVLGGVGDVMQGFEQNDAYDYNAQILENQAVEVATAGALEVEQIGEEETSMLSTQKAMYAKSGVTQSGSPTDVALQTATNFEFDKLVSQYNTKISENKLQSEADMQKYYGKVAVNKGIAGLGKSLLSGAMDLSMAIPQK